MSLLLSKSRITCCQLSITCSESLPIVNHGSKTRLPHMILGALHNLHFLNFLDAIKYFPVQQSISNGSIKALAVGALQ